MSIFQGDIINVMLGDFFFKPIRECDDEDGYHTVWSTEVYDSEGNKDFCYLLLDEQEGRKRWYSLEMNNHILDEIFGRAENLTLSECEDFFIEYCVLHDLSPEPIVKPFTIIIEENLTGEITVNAKDENEAEEVAKKLYRNKKIPIKTLASKQMMIRNNNGAETDWYEF